MEVVTVAKNGMRREGKWEGEREKRKGVVWFLNSLMFVGWHVIDENKPTTSHVPCPLMFVDFKN
jgi:hypothetical protein